MHSLPVIRNQSRPIQAGLGEPLRDSQVETKESLEIIDQGDGGVSCSNERLV